MAFEMGDFLDSRTSDLWYPVFLKGGKMINKTKIVSIVLLFSALILLVSCQQQKAEWKGTIEEVDGVTVVKNPKEPMYGEDVFSLEEELSIGESEGREEYMLSEVGSIAVDDEERIYVSDRKETHIKVFDKNGVYLITIGRKGQGPGEFERISGMQITQQKELLVFDMRIRRISFFSLDGEFIRLKSIGEIQALELKMNSKENFIVDSVLLDPRNFLAVTSLKIFDSNLKLIATIYTSDPKDVLTPFLPFMVWTLYKIDNIVVGYNNTYEFQVLEPEGKLIKKIMKEYFPVKITEEERKERLKQLQQSEKKEVPEFYPAYLNFTVDDDDRIFVQTMERPKNKKGYYYDVFDSEGKFIVKIPLKIRPRIWKKNKLYSIEEDEEGYQYIKRYKVTWKY